MKSNSVIAAAVALAIPVVALTFQSTSQAWAQTALNPPPAKSMSPGVPDTSRDDYIKQREGQFEEWGKKIDDFNAKAAQKSTQASAGSKASLDKAWTDVKSSWGKLQSSSENSWGKAKASFEADWRKLQDSWNKAQS